MDIQIIKEYVLNSIYMLQGNILFLLKDTWLLPTYIKEQVIFNVLSATDNLKRCLNNYYCVRCGCVTDKMLFSSKSCIDNCYTPLMSKKKWNSFKETSFVYKEIMHGEEEAYKYWHNQAAEKI